MLYIVVFAKKFLVSLFLFWPDSIQMITQSKFMPYEILKYTLKKKVFLAFVLTCGSK